MELERYTFLVALSLSTLFIVLAMGIWLRVRASQAKKRNDHSALMKDPRMTHKERSVPEGKVRHAGADTRHH